MNKHSEIALDVLTLMASAHELEAWGKREPARILRHAAYQMCEHRQIIEGHCFSCEHDIDTLETEIKKVGET